MKKQIYEAVESAIEKITDEFGSNADIMKLTVTLDFEFKKNVVSTESPSVAAAVAGLASILAKEDTP